MSRQVIHYGAPSIVIRINEKDHVLTPKDTREILEVKEEHFPKTEAVDSKTAPKPLKDIADKHYGITKAEKQPRDLDNFLTRTLQESRRRST